MRKHYPGKKCKTYSKINVSGTFLGKKISAVVPKASLEYKNVAVVLGEPCTISALTQYLYSLLINNTSV
jgi:hypothetical protein